MTRILAIDTSSTWCSVALSLGDSVPQLRHELVSAGASQLLLPWVQDLLAQAQIKLSDLDVMAVGIGPGAFTGVRLGVAAVQGLAVSAHLPVISVVSLDAIAAQAIITASFDRIKPTNFVVAIDARMDEIYWAKYEYQQGMPLAKRVGEIHLSKPEEIDLTGIHYLAGSAIAVYGERLFTHNSIAADCLDPEVPLSALGILDCAKPMFKAGLQTDVRCLEPLYVRNKVALTTAERDLVFKKIR
ncbi:tRNA (adenosine(37)-N6)-threonylcarbamoyltransferase complex dimerization subunit type 1 TsaB [Polynucleobacter necessarius]|uniref:tRNA (adenosine(37)-N6)-threonylcarbamoyltransferase complex dimerization subunit type 1 TsaB n=1 Tax=Polynucleobacter necessarius TaxID=576610 RepID=UPI000E08F29D|nr:tRNA (adenosine(37)-N6)-threonylcarbamoyltransferase complex dimerization subunit type 1 TsaB [Polynucleobacter necessarius]